MSASGDGRERILNAAYLLFIRHGYAEVSMQQIADAVGLTKATMYHHFRSKDDLFAAVCRRETERIQAGVSEMIAAGGPLRDLLERVARFFLVTGGDADVVRLFGDFHRHFAPDRRAELLAGVRLPSELLRDPFVEAIERGELRPLDPGLAVEMFLGLVMSQVRFALDTRGARVPDPERAPVLVDALLDGIAARAASGITARRPADA